MAEPIRVAIVGAGIGAEHLSAYLALPTHFEVIAICDLDIDRAETLARRARSDVVRNYRDLLNDSTLALVDICTPPSTHFALTSDALKAGKDVICEKPLTGSLRDVDELINLARTSGRSVFPVFQYRWGAAVARLRRLVDAKLTGTPSVATLETHWNRDAAYYGVPWRGTWDGELGGAIVSHALHIHDLLTTVLGPVASVYADLGTRTNEIAVEDCAALSIRMASGALVTSSVTLGAATDTSRMKFCFENVSAQSALKPYAPGAEPWSFDIRMSEHAAAIRENLSLPLDVRQGFEGFVEQVAFAMRGRSNTAPTLIDGRASIDFASAVYLSAQNRASVDVPLAHGSAVYTGWQPRDGP